MLSEYVLLASLRSGELVTFLRTALLPRYL
jgi:hypothetical protein